ncbi:hypothetical protein N7539_001767 [Penicillium diatomitis]|uniref:Uncharacterized protein n=1 Tax=Penicillium diatomitis TaxID=2819901 RepID=A0A9W9XHE2_9EURO|nr:uncharacterized protein N7539_001767 [Penicillium diatomitis]KAJ5493021.1 hypothetical protein N7539_001767 [Penicillium diatomitis]
MTESLQFFSPKRKREPSESDYYSPSPSITSDHSIETSHEGRIVEEADIGSHSPRAAVAGRFKNLNIRSDNGTIPVHSTISPLSSKSPLPELAPSARESSEGKPFGTASSTNVHTVEWTAIETQQASIDSECQTLPDSNARLVTPVSTPSKRKIKSPSQSRWSPSSKSPRRRLSPSPSAVSEVDPLTWHDDEITGHNPTDPSDDGYGINGIGFKPTAAIAWARARKRQRQVEEWKSREAREARQKRQERRHEGSSDGESRGAHKSTVQKRVKFDEPGSG